MPGKATTKRKANAKRIGKAKESNPMAYSLDALSQPKPLGSFVDANEKPIIPTYRYQKKVLMCEKQFQIWLWSRQTGKSFSMSLKAVIRALETGRNQLILSASQSQSDELMEKVRMHAEAMGVALKELESEEIHYKRQKLNKRVAVLPNGARIITLPANPRTARGFTGDVYLDEFAMHQWDRKIWAAVFPSITRGGGMLIICSTPMGMQNLFYKLQSNPKFVVFKVTIHDAIADGYPAKAEDLKEGIDDEELWQQEYLCEFLDEATAFLSYENIQACERADLTKFLPMEYVAEGDLFVGIDIGRKHDLTVIWVCELLNGIMWTRGIIELSKTPFAEQEKRIFKILSMPNVRRCCIDATGLGMQLAESMKKKFKSKVEEVTFSMAVKEDMAGKLRVHVEDQSILIPVDKSIRDDWHAVKKVVTKSGNIRFEADRGPGGHADRFWGAALCCEAAGTKTKRVGCWSPRNRKVA
jgi:phage FluMu gp28-like protein